MLNGVRPLRALALGALLAALGCHAQTTAQVSGAHVIQVGSKLSPDMARRIELMIRSKAELSPDYIITVGDPATSDIPGYYQVNVSFAIEGKPVKSAMFLLSDDGRTLAQFNKFDISQDPRERVSAVGRPSRGGPPDAPVLIVGFDDLECPFCAQMNALLPAVLDRYKNQVQLVYRDFPLEQHPWAIHAAVDANCLATASTTGYWNFVDYVHAHSADIAGTEKTLEKANQTLDKLVLDEGTRQKVDQSALIACVLKQDDSGVKASLDVALADPLRIDSAPILYINGEKVEGVVPIETIYRIIDQALVAAGQTPPPALPAPAAPPAAKPGS